MPLDIDQGWGDGNYWSADDPGNGRGNPPGHPIDGGAGSSNFQISAPLLGLEGRGLNVSLGLTYNSRVWNKASNVINFDIDRDWPAPGWSLGFGKILDLGAGGSMIVDADGTRHSFTGNIGPSSGGTLFTGHTTDGTLIQYQTWKNASGLMTFGELNLPDGSQIHYYATGPGGVFPTDVVDANGNYITITYVNNTGPRIQTVTDTLNRVISFYYDYHNLLTAITTPGYGSGDRTLVRLTYHQITLNASSYSFGLTPVVRDPNPWLLHAIYYPGTSTGYWFGDSDSYSTYGMLAKSIEQRGMSFSGAALTDMGTVTQGQMTRKEVYNYPLYVGDSSGTASSNLSDAPTFTVATESWTRDGDPSHIDSAATNYLVEDPSTNPSQPTITSRKVEVTQPNGTKSIQYSYNYTSLPDSNPLKALDGLVYQDETRDSAGNSLQSSTANWEKGSFDSPRPIRVQATNERGQMSANEFSYGANYNQVTEVRNFDYGGTVLLRATRTQYQNSASYATTRHILNLPLVVEVFAADNTTRVSRVDYQYDGQTLADTPGVVMHSDNHNPYAAGYNPITDARGNITQVTTYADAIGQTGAVTQTRRYDIDGNMVKASTSCCEQTSISYTVDTKYAYPLSQTRGSATDPYAQLTTSVTYDFNTGLSLSSTDANGRTSQTSYIAATLRPQTLSLPSLAHTDYVYDDSAMTVTQTTYLEGHPTHTTIADQDVKLLNGRGQVRQEQSLSAPNVWDVVDLVYDNMGRVSKESRAYRTGDTPRWRTMTYDALGRAKKVIESDYTLADGSDGSTSEMFYNEQTRPSVASSSQGETTRFRDPWGRERWSRMDALGKLVEVVEPAALGSGSVFDSGAQLTTYAYNTMGNLTSTTQDVQTRLFKYDSLGRVVAQKLAERSATLNDAGTYQSGGGTWSDVFTYDDRSNLISRIDARGVKTVLTYNNDPLNRLQSVSWDTSGFGDSANPIVSAPTITYAYRTKNSPTQRRDITQLTSITASGVSTESFLYDSEERATTKTLTLNSRPAYPFVTDFSFDALDRMTDVTYPAEYGNGQAPRQAAHTTYDVASRLTGVTVGGAAYASQVTYNAASQTTSLKVGASGANQITENYGYDSLTGFLASQSVVRGTSPSATTLMDLAYTYTNASGKRTGQLTKLLNNLNHNRDRSYAYDALGRLIQATGGLAGTPLWTQTYGYDRFGNRTSVSSSGYSARVRERENSPLKNGAANAGTAAASRDAALLLAPGIPSEPETSAAPTVASAERTSEVAPAESSAPRLAPAAEQVAADSRPASSSSSRQAAPPTMRSHHAPSTTRTTAAMPQAGPPTFTEDPLNVPVKTPIKALHITELRYWIDQLRVRAGLTAASWQQPVGVGLTITAAPIQEMRTKLDDALGALHLTTGGYSAGLAQNLPVLAIHIQELRDRVKAGWNSSSSIPTDGLAAVTYETTSNRITTAGFDYDKSGNQVRALTAGGGPQRFQYDAANRLVNVKTDDNQTTIASYTYGANNQRLMTQESSARTYYVAASGGCLAEYTEAGSSVTPAWGKSYIYFGSRLLSTLQPNGGGGEAIRHHHPDRLGTRLVSNPSDGTYFEQASLPFGTALNAESTGSSNRRFTSYDRSSTTGLDYAINRHYDAQQGRFTQVDPIGMRASSLSDPQSLNLYAYCGNDPVNGTDHDGLFWGKLWRAIKKVLTSKWFVIAVTVALLVITIGSSAFGWSLAKTVFMNLGPSGFGGPLLIPIGQTATTLGWVSTGLQAALAVGGISFSAKAMLSNVLTFAVGIGISQVLSTIARAAGSLGVGGTPTWNPNSNGLQQGHGAAHGPPVFTTMDLAAAAALRRINRRSRRQNREYAGRICQNANGFTFTPAVMGTQDSSDPNASPCPTGSTTVASYHTHGANNPLYENEQFSNIAGDIQFATSEGMPAYLATPARLMLVYDPAVGTTIQATLATRHLPGVTP
ncbi:MAG TPA: DUF4329 domain-containing protein [Pyrinomonadaceae bacterium]|nr:DUF4329 domain-containing protein [Pyrinomonadaceae bacterium]